MSYDDEMNDGGVEVVAVDDRVALMQKISDMERARDHLQGERDKLAKKADGLSGQINQARNDLAKRMGWDTTKLGPSEDNLRAFYGESR